MDNFIKEVCEFMGSQIISRVAGMIGLPDFDLLEDPKSRNCASRLSRLITDALVMKRNSISSVDDIINIVETITYRYFMVFRELCKNLV